MSNRRDFLKLLGFGAISPIIPKIPVEYTEDINTKVLSGKIKTGGLVSKIENDGITFNTNGAERMRLYTNSSMMKMYEDSLWFGNNKSK